MVNFKNGETPLNEENLNKMQVDLQKEIKDLPINKNNNEEVLLQSSIIKTFAPENSVEYENYGNCYYYKIGTRIHLHLGLKMTSTEFKKIFTMPLGYRPYTRIGFITQGSGTDNVSGIQIEPDGTINVKSNNLYILADVEYDAFN